MAALLALPLNFAAAKPKPGADAAHDGRVSASPELRNGVGATAPLAAGVFLSGPDVSGSARVIDGDTLDVDGTRVRLEGIDAPEHAQLCNRNDGTKWRCGRQATRALRQMTAGAQVRCYSRGHGSYGRMLGLCFAGRLQLNAELVRRGLAWAFVKYSRTYVGLEAVARQRKVGIWQGPAQRAWDYRANRWASAEGDAPNGCAIKGNITRRGHIYHMPWSPWYGRVRIETKKGERWFCSEAEAVAAGWRSITRRH